jgi:hypothetical protein
VQDLVSYYQFIEIIALKANTVFMQNMHFQAIDFDNCNQTA